MKLSRNIVIVIVGLISFYTVGSWLVWEYFIKVSWCQKKSSPGYLVERPVVIGFDSSGVDKSEAEQAKTIIFGVVNNPRGWRQARVDFTFENKVVDVTFHIVTPDKLASMQQCSVQYSCRVGRDIYINSTRWHEGSPSLSIPLSEYRAMVINHELGHALGFNHWQCYGHGIKAPVMQQQSVGLGGLLPNAWPIEEEIKVLSSQASIKD